MTTLNITGENAGAAKLRIEFSTPIASAESPINKRYGNMIWVSSVVSASLPGSLPNPGAISGTNHGAITIPSTLTPVRTVNKVVNAALASSQASR